MTTPTDCALAQAFREHAKQFPSPTLRIIERRAAEIDASKPNEPQGHQSPPDNIGPYPAHAEAVETLFAMHLLGPDEIYAAPSYEAALRVANSINVEFADRPVKPYAVVVPWLRDPDSHAAGLADWEGTWS